VSAVNNRSRYNGDHSVKRKDMGRKDRPHTKDGRYLVAKGVLKRCTDPRLDDTTRRKAIKKLMQARMSKDRQAVLVAKTELGEAGPVWWDDGAPDYSGKHPADTPYCDWWKEITPDENDQ